MVNKFQIAKARAEVLESIYNHLETEYHCCATHYGRTGKQVQSKHWDSDAKEYVLDFADLDCLIPVMVDEWDDIEYTDEELESMPEIDAKKSALKEMMKKIENML